MKKLFKITSLILAGLLFVSLIFGAGVYASEKGWLNFTGDKKIEQSELDIDKIMNILEDTHNGKLSAESALAELEGHSPKGLVDKIKTLEKDVSEKDKTIVSNNSEIEKLKVTNGELTTDLAAANKAKTDAENALVDKQTELDNSNSHVRHLEGELRKANEAAQSVSNKTTEALTKAQGYVTEDEE